MKTDQRQRLLIILTIAVVGFFVADKVIFTPLTNWWHTRSAEIAKLQNDIRNGNSLQRREHALRARWDSYQKNTLPNDQSAQDRIYQAIEDWAQESGASINGVSPQWKNGDSEKYKYKTLVCRVDASGRLWDLCRFLYDVEKGPMALKVESLDLSSRDNTGQQLTLALQISGLVLTPEAK